MFLQYMARYCFELCTLCAYSVYKILQSPVRGAAERWNSECMQKLSLHISVPEEFQAEQRQAWR